VHMYVCIYYVHSLWSCGMRRESRDFISSNCFFFDSASSHSLVRCAWPSVGGASPSLQRVFHSTASYPPLSVTMASANNRILSAHTPHTTSPQHCSRTHPPNHLFSVSYPIPYTRRIPEPLPTPTPS
jgi:hypothetical protein